MQQPKLLGRQKGERNGNDNIPICGKVVTDAPLGDWIWEKYIVNNYRCSSCKKTFRLYKNNNDVFTILKPKRIPNKY